MANTSELRAELRVAICYNSIQVPGLPHERARRVAEDFYRGSSDISATMKTLFTVLQILIVMFRKTSGFFAISMSETALLTLIKCNSKAGRCSTMDLAQCKQTLLQQLIYIPNSQQNLYRAFGECEALHQPISVGRQRQWVGVPGT